MKIKQSIDRIFKNKFDLYLPCRELLHTGGGRLHKIKMPMFPGYLFIHSEIDTFIQDIRNSYISDYIRPLRSNCQRSTVQEQEMEFLINLTDAEGVVRISKGIVDENNNVEIVKGPLKRFTGKIVFFNKKKRKARIQMQMMNREVFVTLGVEIL